MTKRDYFLIGASALCVVAGINFALSPVMRAGVRRRDQTLIGVGFGRYQRPTRPSGAQRTERPILQDSVCVGSASLGFIEAYFFGHYCWVMAPRSYASALSGEAGRDAALRWVSAPRPLATHDTEGSNQPRASWWRIDQASPQRRCWRTRSILEALRYGVSDSVFRPARSPALYRSAGCPRAGHRTRSGEARPEGGC